MDVNSSITAAVAGIIPPTAQHTTKYISIEFYLDDLH